MPPWARRILNEKSLKVIGNFNDLEACYNYLRSTIRLLEKAPPNTQKEYRHLMQRLEYAFSKEGFGKVLNIQSLLRSLHQLKIGAEQPHAKRKATLNIEPSIRCDNELQQKTQSYLLLSQKKRARKEWKWRLKVAIQEAVNDGWYPIFGTYTVDPKRLPDGCLTRDDLWQKTPAWDRFVKSWKRDIAEACGHTRKASKWPPGYTFFQYFAVLEHGKSGEHPHIHVIFLCKEIPQLWKRDPNTLNPEQTSTDIAPASALWTHGIQRRTMGLFIAGSWFAEHWKVPRKKGANGETRPGQVGSAEQIAGYIGKYLMKGETKKWNHRVKATKNLGMHQVQNQLQKKTTMRILLTLALRPNEYKTQLAMQTQTSCPMSLLRRNSKKELLRRWHSSNNAQARDCLFVELTKMSYDYFTLLQKSVRRGTKIWKLSHEELFNFFTLILGESPPEVHSKIEPTLKWLRTLDAKIPNTKPYVLLKGET